MIEISTLLLGLLMLIVTAVYVYYTKQLLEETIKMREVETSPFVNCQLIPKQGFSKVVIENIGKSPAYDLEIEFEEKVLKQIKTNCYKTYKSNLSYFGVSQYIDIPFLTQNYLDLNEEILVKLKYKSSDGQEFSDSVRLSFEAGKDFGTHYPKAAYEDNFEKLTKEVKNIVESLEKSRESKSQNVLSAEDINNMAKLYSSHKGQDANPISTL